MARSFQRSSLALAILALLYEAPMHPYRMQQLIKERGKDKVINVRRRASLYQTITQLQRAGLIAVQETLRDENRPERTVYQLTELGYRTARDWLREILSTPEEEFPQFPAAISFLPLLKAEEVLQLLEKRAGILAAKIADMDAELRETLTFLPRLFLLEDELILSTLEAELKWVRSIIEDLRSGQLTWSEEALRPLIPPYSEE